jgi:thiamine biosynthesis protein ThiI
MEKIIMIRYGELSTKKENKKFFVDKLFKNVNNVLKGYNISINKNNIRMYIELKDSNELEIINKLKNVFGIQGIVLCYKIETNFETIKNECLDLMKKENFKTFRVTTNRAYKPFTYNSMETSKMVGAHILKNINNINVDLHNPEITLNIEIRNKKDNYIYIKEIEGLKGYPVGIQGKGLLMLSGGIDSPVAGYLSMKRGIDIDCIYFESPPHTSNEARNKVVSLARLLSNYGSDINIHIVPFTKIQESIYRNIDHAYMITIMRRMMYRISEIIAKKIKSKVIINGESIGQVASQTLQSMYVINNVTNMPVIRPVACLDKLEIIEISKKINAYETSILPYEDCCTIFVPEHPAINPSLSKCIEYESLINYEQLINECINNIEIISVNGIENKYSSLL